MSSEEAERWKEKYLKSIEQQEKLERRWDARLDLLRRGLVRSTLAAEGTDRAVDQCMKEMRDVVRSDEMDAALAALLPRLEKAVLDSEQRRETRIEQMNNALTSLVSQLQTLPLPREIRRPLKHFAKQLGGRVTQQREIPLLLSELSGLQGKALKQLEPAVEPVRPGLLQRLFGGKDSVPETNPESAPVAPTGGDEPATPIIDAVAPEPEARVSEPAPASEPVAVAAVAPLAPSIPASPASAEPEAAPVSPKAATEPEAPPVSSKVTTEPDAVRVSEPVTVQAYVPAVIQPPAAVVVEPAEAPSLVAAAEPQRLPLPLATAEAGGVSTPVVGVAQASALAPPATQPALPVFIDSLPLPAKMAEALAAIDPECPEPDALFALPETPEPSYSSVAEHIESTLLGLLNDLTLPERHQAHAEAMRQRLEHGLNWYELLPMLDDLAVLMLAINDSGQRDFELYLKQLNERLESFQSHLQEASVGHAEGRTAANELHSQLREHVDGLQSSMQDAADLESLKHVLESRLEGLLGTMDQHQQQRAIREQQVAERLRSLAERVAHMEQEAQGYRDHLEEQRQKALVDPLTGLPNRAAWSERLEQEVAHWQQHGNTLLIAMLDLDHFKRINDNYGHLAGDKVLKIIAGELRKRLRPGDFIARFGGEEFVLLVPNTPIGTGLKLVEILRAAIEACPFHFKGERVTITVSVGLSAFRSGERSDHALKRADEALYRAKNAGRNRVEQG